MMDFSCKMDGRSNINPFVVESPEKLLPNQIVNLFIERYTQLEVIKERKHTFIWGSRGSGKSMMLRYIEPQCQIVKHGDFETFLKSVNPFIAIYCPCKEGQLNKSELSLLNEYALLVVVEHMMNLYIADRIVHCLRKQIPASFFDPVSCKEYAKKVINLFDSASIASSVEQAESYVEFDDEPFKWLQSVLESENRKVSTYLKRTALQSKDIVYGGATSGYHDFLLPLVRYTKNLLRIEGLPIYILLDDADKLAKFHQSIINTWIANRDQADLCLKVSSNRERYKTFLTRDKGQIEQPHDYSEIDVEELYTRSKSDYANKVKLIANKRLELSDVSTKDIEAFLPDDATESKLIEKFKKSTAKEWEEIGKPGRQSDFVTRYSMARLFQHLKATKRPKNYAGFQNIVHISSGVVRDFLEPCYLMFDSCISKGLKPDEINEIPPSLQNEIIDTYSQELLIMRFEDIRKDLPPEKWSQLESLRTLIESFGRLFYERLHDPDAREARLFSFTVRGTIPQDIKEVLDLGVKYRYFQVSTYSSKEGGGRETWYILNRRLCPSYKLDPTGFEGRISITPDFLVLACTDHDKFVRLRLKHKTGADAPYQEPLFSLEE